MTEISTQILTQSIPETMVGMRLDQVLAELFSQYSRARLQKWIKQGDVVVDGRQMRPRDKVLGGEEVVVTVKTEQETRFVAQPIELAIVYEDEQILVINKPAGLVVHPAAGNPDGTMLNALLHHAPELAHVPRAGIVHRLDKDTSGLLVVARTLEAQTALVVQLQAREFLREYETVVSGVMTAGGSVDVPIGRHPVQRKRMAVVTHGGKPAISHYRVQERFRAHTYVSVRLDTGRTHQIRVHMAHIHYPIVGDPTYGGRLKIPKQCSEGLILQLRGFRRQALHARHLGIVHPSTGVAMDWTLPTPGDIQALLDSLREDHSLIEKEGRR